MDQKLRSKGSLTSSIILAGGALMAIVLGVSMLTDYPKELWWVGVILIVSAVIISFYAVKAYHLTQKQGQLFNEEQPVPFDITSAVKTVDKSKVEILVSWVYSASEWKEFLKWEKKATNSNTVTEVVLLVVLATLGIHYLTGAEWSLAVIGGFVLGGTYSVIKYFINLYSLPPEENKMPEIIITTEAVIVNGQVKRFYGPNLRLGKITVNDTGNFNVLEITYCWKSSEGKNFDDIRIPVPKGSLKEAIFLQEKLMNEKAKLA